MGTTAGTSSTTSTQKADPLESLKTSMPTTNWGSFTQQSPLQQLGYDVLGNLGSDPGSRLTFDMAGGNMWNGSMLWGVPNYVSGDQHDFWEVTRRNDGNLDVYFPGAGGGDQVGVYDPEGKFLNTYTGTKWGGDWSGGLWAPVALATAGMTGMLPGGSPSPVSIDGFMASAPMEGAGGVTTLAGAGDAGLMYAGQNAAAAGTLGGGASVLGGASLMGSGAGGADLLTQFRDFFNSPAGKAAGKLVTSGMSGGGGMGTSSGGGSTTTVQRADPWSGIQPALLDMYARALAQSQGAGPQYYGGSTLAGQSPETLQALQMLAQRARAGSPVTRGAQDTLQATIKGDYLNSNPFLDEMFDSASSSVGRNFRANVMPGVASMFSKSGRFGSNSMAEGLGQAEQQYGNTLKELADEIYGKNYSRERLFQQQALSLAPTLANQDYADLAQLAGVGTSRDQYAQAGIDADKARWDYNQMLPRDQLTWLNSILQGGMSLNGSTSTQNVNTPKSPLLGALGGAMLGGSVGNMFGDDRTLGGFDLGTLGMVGGGILGGLFS